MFAKGPKGSHSPPSRIETRIVGLTETCSARITVTVAHRCRHELKGSDRAHQSQKQFFSDLAVQPP
jgi:hypothetical protein